MTEIQEEVTYDQYKIWKRNSLVLYDLCLSYVLEYPALSFDFSSVISSSKFKFGIPVQFCFSTNTPKSSVRDQNLLYVKQVVLPSIFSP